MNFIFNKKIVSCLFVLCVLCLCISAVSAVDVHHNNANDGFNIFDDEVCANVHNNFNGSHWEIGGCKGYKLASCEFHPADSKDGESSDLQIYHFQKLPVKFLDLFSSRYIKLNEIDSNGKIVNSIKYPGSSKVNDFSNGFTVSGDEIHATVSSDSSTGAHWELCSCKGYKFISYELCPTDSKNGSLRIEKYHFKISDSDGNLIKLNKIDSKGNIIDTMEYPGRYNPCLAE